MRFVLLLGFLMVSARLAPFAPDQISGLMTLLVVVFIFDLVDFVMNIIKTFRSK
jgi:hypothetical protein